MIYRVLFGLLFSFLILNSYSQPADTTLIVKNLKARLFTEVQISFMSENGLEDYSKRELLVTVLKSKGFDNFIFFRIDEQVLAIDTIYENDEIRFYSTPICLNGKNDCSFIYAFNTEYHNFYRLKGTKSNDFRGFYSFIFFSESRKTKINKSDISRLMSKFWIEDIDLECLLLSLKTNKGDCLNYFSPQM